MARRGADHSRLQAELERLYALPPAAFTAARNELAARLRREGRRDAVAEVKALPGPTASSWAVSRLMRLEPARFQALLAAGRQARQAQRQVLGGGAAATAAAAARLRDALHNARTAIEELRRRGLELLAASGRKVSPAVADRLSADLQALAFTAEAESAIERGWLDHDLEAPGFEVLAGLQAAAGSAVTPSRPREGPAERLSRPRSAPERKGPRGRPGQQETPSRGRFARDNAQARLEAVRQRQEQARREREQDRLRQARDRELARVAEAEAEVRHAAAETARLAAAAEAAERDAAAAAAGLKASAGREPADETR